MIGRLWSRAPDWVKKIVFGILLPLLILFPGAVWDAIPKSYEDVKTMLSIPPDVTPGFKPAPFGSNEKPDRYTRAGGALVVRPGSD
jgi:hypothetical protein